MQIKSVPFQAKITHKDTSQTVANQLQNLLDTHANDGWEFLKLETVEAFSPASGGCFGVGATQASFSYFSMAVFAKTGNKNAAVTSTPKTQTVLPVLQQVEQEEAVIEIPNVVQHISVSQPEPIETAVKNTPSSYANLFDMPATVVTDVQNAIETEPILPTEKPTNMALAWVIKYKIILGSIFLLGVGGVGVYQFHILPTNARKEGNTIGEMACDCESRKTINFMDNLRQFYNAFENNHFSTQSAARDAYDGALSSQVTYDNCISNVNSRYRQLANKYIGNEKLYEQYSWGYDERYNYCNKINTSECDRFKNQIEQKISYLPTTETWQGGDGGIENVVTSVEAAFYNKNGSLIVEPEVLNVRDQPDKERGNVVFKVQKGMQFNFNDIDVDDRGIIWYTIQSEGLTGWVSGLFAYVQGIEATVRVPQTFFYDLDYNTLIATSRKQYLEQNQTTKVFKKVGLYVYTEYTNTQGNTTKGWLLKSDLR